MKNEEVSKLQLSKIKERFATLTDQLRRAGMLLKRRESSFLELEDKHAQLEREYEIEKEKNSRLEQQLKESMEGTLDVEAIKNATVLNAQITSLKRELEDTQGKMTKLKSDTVLKIKALQEGLQDEMTKAARAKSELESQLAQLQEERQTFAHSKELIENLEKQVAEAKVQFEKIQTELQTAQEKNETQNLDFQKVRQEHNEELLLRNKKEEEFLQAIEKLQAENVRLEDICRVFDVITLESDIIHFQDEVHHALKHPDQNELLRKLEVIELFKTRIDAFEKLTADRVANYFNAILELEAQLRNHILLEE